MDYRESHVVTADGLTLLQRCWLPEAPTAVVVVIHGLAEHSGRYAPLAAQLVAAGYAVYALDLRGHGRSGGRRIYIDSFRQHVEDVTCFWRYVQLEQPQCPYFLLGHSMGGLIVTALAANGLPGVRGVILSAAALKVHEQVAPLLRWLAWPASLVLPRWGVAQLTFKKVSRDPAVIASYEADPLVHHGMLPNRTGYELLRAGARLRRRFAAVRQPLLVLHGTADAITDPQGSQRFYEQAGSSDKTLKFYEGLAHNLFHEPEHDQVVADLLQWLATYSRQEVGVRAGSEGQGN